MTWRDEWDATNDDLSNIFNQMMWNRLERIASAIRSINTTAVLCGRQRLVVVSRVDSKIRVHMIELVRRYISVRVFYYKN